MAGNASDASWNAATPTTFVDRLANDENVTSIRVCASSYIDSVTLTTNKRVWPTHGGTGGTCVDNALATGEQIVRILGRAGSIIDQISFLTSLGRTIGPFGGAGGQTFSMSVAGSANGHFGGFSGYSGTSLQQLNLLDDTAGGVGGVAFIDRLKPDQRVTAVTICYRADAFVQSIQLRTNLGVLPKHGTDWPGLPCNTTTLAEGEYVTELFGSAGAYVDSLGYKTNKGVVVGPFGGPGGAGFSQSITTGTGFTGIYGRSNGWVHRIGMLTAAQGDTAASLFADQLPAGQAVSHVELCMDVVAGTNYLRSLQASYANGSKNLPFHGGAPTATSNCNIIFFQPGEFITEMTGRYSKAITSIQLRTNRNQVFGPYGDTAVAGKDFVVRNPVTDAFLGFAGRATYTSNPDTGLIHAIDAAAPDVFELVAAPNVDAAKNGWWGTAMNWPIIGLHAVVLPDGRVMTYGTDASGTQGAQFVYDVWNPLLGNGEASHLTLDNTTGTDLFCSSQSLLPGGEVVIAGGDNRQKPGGYNAGIADTTIFNANSNAISSSLKMKYARWYASQVVLPSGRIVVMGGKDEKLSYVSRPEVRGLDGKWNELNRIVNGANTIYLVGYYPRAFVTSTTIPGVEQVYIITTDGSGKIYRMKINADNTGELINTGVKLPGLHNWTLPTAQISPNTILVALESGESATVTFPTTEGELPVVAPAGKLSQVRVWGNFVTLPTGEVLAINGSNTDNKLDKVAYHGEIWSPVTRTWRTVASELRPRLYHGTAFLLPDGRVMSVGGGAPGPVNGTNAQAYSPPYLFTANGGEASRPVITQAPAKLAYGVEPVAGGDTISVLNTADIARVTLVRLASVTHSFDSEQRFIELSFTAVDANQLLLRRPLDRSYAPPGYFLLTVINKAGVPSVSKVVQM